MKNSNFASVKEETLKNLNGYWKNSRKWLSARQRKIKSYQIFKLQQINGTFYNLHKRVKFTKFREHYGINKTNRCIGFTPDHVGPSISKIVDKRNYFIDFLKSNKEELKNSLSNSCYSDLLSSLLEERVVYSAGFTTCGQHLKEYFKDNQTDEIWTVENIISVLELSNFKWFKSAVCEFHDGEEVLNTVKMNPNAYAGHYSSMLFGKKKGSSNYAAKFIAYKLWKSMKTTVVKNFYLWTILGREKDIKIDTDCNKEVGTRVVMTCEHPITLLLCWFAQKISRIVCNDDLWDCKFNVDGEFNNSKYKKLIDKEKNYDFILEADWSYYDSNIDTNFLITAGLIICSGLPRDQLHRNIRYLIISSIVSKYVIVPPGIVVELNRAQPSGHPFGTLTNCYVNIIYWSLIGQKIYGDNYHEMMDIEVYGDDTRAYFKNHKNLVNIDQYVEECGLKSDSLINNFRAINERPELNHQIDFLKRRFDETGIVWNHKKMFDKMLYPSKNRSINNQYRMVSSWFESVPTDNDALIIRESFGKYIVDNHNEILEYDIVLLIKNNKNFVLGSDIRSVKKFQFYNYKHDINKTYNYLDKIDSQTIIYRDYCDTNEDSRLMKYISGTQILCLMALNPDKYTSKTDFLALFGERDPPNFEKATTIDSRLNKFIKKKIKLYSKLIISKSKLSKYKKE